MGRDHYGRSGGSRQQTTVNLITVSIGLLECVLFCGVIFGWANLEPVFLHEGYFAASCPVPDIWNSLNETLTVKPEPIECTEQNHHMRLVFTLASCLLNFSSLFTGFLLDYFGTLVSKLCAAFLFISGLVVIGISSPETSWMLYLGYGVLMPIGGYWAFISNMQIGNLFAKRQGTVVTLMSGCFDSSSAVFFVFKHIYFDIGVPLSTLFYGYSVAAMFLGLNAIFFLPRTYIPFPLPEGWNRNYKPKKLNDDTCTDNCLNNNSGGKVEDHQGEKDKHRPRPLSLDSQASVPEREKTFLDCVVSLNYILHVVFLSVNQLKLYVFLNTVYAFVHTYEADEETHSYYMTVFGLIQLCGIIAAPMMGMLIDRNKNSRNRVGGSLPHETLADFALPLALACITSLIFSCCLVVPYIEVLYATFIVQVMLRAFTYGLAFSFISCNFPACHIGKLIGLMMATAALISLAQFPLLVIVERMFDGNPTVMNQIFIGVGLVAFLHPVHVWLDARKKAPRTPRLQDDVGPLTPVGETHA